MIDSIMSILSGPRAGVKPDAYAIITIQQTALVISASLVEDKGVSMSANSLPIKLSGRVLWVVALQIEATPLIAQFRLRREMDEHHWPVYQNQQHRLIVSGVGQLNAAMAVAWLLAREENPPVALINFGICGSNHPDLPPGTLLQASAVTDAETRHKFLPDLYSDWPLPRQPLTCVNQVVDSHSPLSDDRLTCDMESAGIMTAGRRFLQTHQLFLFKVVSDRLEPQSIDRSKLKHWLVDAAGQVETYLPDIVSLAEDAQPVSIAEHEAIMIQAESVFCPSQSMRRQLEHDIRRALLRGLSPADIISQMPSQPVQGRTQGKQALLRWHDALLSAAASSGTVSRPPVGTGRTQSGETE